MNYIQNLSRDEMRSIKAGDMSIPKDADIITDEFGCQYSSSKIGCQSYYACLQWVCTSEVFEKYWDTPTCVSQVTTLSLQC